MFIVCSIVALIVIAGHALAIWHARLYWPFSYYPMYSLPLGKLIYPIVEDSKLTVLSLVDISDPQNPKDLFSPSGTFPPPFRPFDKLEVAYLMAEATTLLKERNAKGMGRVEDSTKKFANVQTEAVGNQLEKVISRLFRMAEGNGFSIKALQVVKLEWNNYRDRNAHYLRPDKMTIIGEFHDHVGR